MPVVAITGTICSGKSTVARLFREKGVKIFDADKLVHRLYNDKRSRVYKVIAKRYPEVLTAKKNISRKRIQQLVYSDPKILATLESAVHPEVIRSLKLWVTQVRRKDIIAVAEIPLLFEKKLDTLFDEVIMVKSSRNNILSRIRKKFKVSPIQAQKKLAFVQKRKKAYKSRFVIVNDSTRKKLEVHVDNIWSILSNKTNKHT
ncbi:MAG: dephospho-CoA kinase [Candidatus Omnitrophica bacterium]|nr:dephospho-CoA kinase [Candidatus Omnitrophota bacterium]